MPAEDWEALPYLDWRTWLWRYALPSLLLSAPWMAPWLLFSSEERAADDADGLVLLLGFVLLPLAALLVGFVTRPAQPWIAPAAAFVLLWLGIGVIQGRDEVRLEEVIATLLALAGPQAALAALGCAAHDRLRRMLSAPLHLPHPPRPPRREPHLPA